MLNAEDGSDITRPFLGQHVVDRSLGADGLELLSVAAGEHRGHVAAVTSAEHADSVGITERILLQGTVENGKDILDVCITPSSPWGNGVFAAKNRLTPRLLATTGATWIAHEHDETGGRLHLCFVEERFAVLRVWPTVHVEEHRVLLRCVEVLWLHDPCINLGWTTGVRGAARDGEVFPRLRRNGIACIGAMTAELALHTIDDGEYFRQLVHRTRDESDGGTCCVQTLGNAPTSGDPLGCLFSCWVDSHGMSRATILCVCKQRAVVHPDWWHRATRRLEGSIERF